MMEECKHEKVYANNVLTSNPPQYPWICRKCGDRGTDVGAYVGISEYEELMEKFDSRDEVGEGE